MVKCTATIFFLYRQLVLRWYNLPFFIVPFVFHSSICFSQFLLFFIVPFVFHSSFCFSQFLLFFMCNSTGGNPPPIASWYKDGNLVSGLGYLTTILSLKNVTRSDRGIYSCFVESHDLKDKRKVQIEVLCKLNTVNCCL